MSDQRVQRCLDPGTSVIVGTVDAAGTPSCCRAIALASSDDLATATVYLPMATSHQVIQDIATTRRLAVVASHVIEHASVQLKGAADGARVARADEEPFVRRRLEAFADMLDRIGVPRRIGRSIAHWPAFAVDLRIDEVFDQTPGPNAGSRVR